MGILHFLSSLNPFAKTRRRRNHLRKTHKRRRRTTRRMRGGWGGEPVTPSLQQKNIMHGGWGGAIQPNMNV